MKWRYTSFWTKLKSQKQLIPLGFFSILDWTFTLLFVSLPFFVPFCLIPVFSSLWLNYPPVRALVDLLLVLQLCCEMYQWTQSCLCRLALTRMAEVPRTRAPMWPARGKEGGWRGIITYRTLTQLFHNTWREHIKSLGVFAADRSPQLERDFREAFIRRPFV